LGNFFLLHITHSNQELNLYFHRHDDDDDDDGGGGGDGSGSFSYPKQECRSNNPMQPSGDVLMHKPKHKTRKLTSFD
jgi:hypothetical protein